MIGFAIKKCPCRRTSGCSSHERLACAEEQGFDEVYTNDRHMLEAARYFHVTGVNVLTDKSGCMHAGDRRTASERR